MTSSTNPRAEFEVDAVIKSVQPEIRNDKETGRLYVNAIIFNYANAAIPARFVVENQAGVKFFSNIEPMTFTRIWGQQVNSTVTNEKMEESAFGEAKVVKSSYTKREFVITGAQTEAYDDTQITQAEIQSALQARNVYIAELKAKQDKAPASKPAAATPVGVGSFNF